MSPNGKTAVIPIAPLRESSADEPKLVSLFEKTTKIYPRAVSGAFARWRCCFACPS